MKPISEILELLISEIVHHLEKIKSIQNKPIYYNQILGDTSFLLAGLLESVMKKNFKDWDRKYWFDDSLINNVNLKNNRLQINGVMIFGKENTTDQWTAPFSFEIDLPSDINGFKKFTLSFYDLDVNEISYEEYRANIRYWELKNHRNWKYIIKSEELLKEIY